MLRFRPNHDAHSGPQWGDRLIARLTISLGVILFGRAVKPIKMLSISKIQPVFGQIRPPFSLVPFKAFYVYT